MTVPQLPCEVPYDFVYGETFNGPVYTNDQLHVCGSPVFNGSPVSLTSGAPSDVPYLYERPRVRPRHSRELRYQRPLSVVASSASTFPLATRWTR